MIDQTSQFFAILTNIGTAKQANADALGIAWKITQMGVGDANGTDPIPSAAQTALINERRRAPLNQLKVDPTNSAIIVAEQVIPEDVGGWWIREIGLYDADGDLVAIANCAPSFKPLLTQGSGRTQVVRMNMIVSNSSNVELKIDPSVVLATRAYVDAKVQEEIYKLDSKQSVKVATTANIALTGLQSLDGIALVAGDRVLVKNQTLAKDNGLYVAAAGAWARAADADGSPEVTSALLMSVEQGTTQADTSWQLVTDGAIILGTTALTFQNITQGFAPLASPSFSGNPTVPTATAGDNDTSIASTAFVQYAVKGVASIALNATGDTVVTVAQAGAGILNFTGALTGNVTVTLPAGVTGRWLVFNSTSGAFTVTVRNPTGASVVVTQSRTAELYANGSLVVFANTELSNVLLSGVPTAPTAALGTNTTQIATMAALQAAINNLISSAPGALDTLNELAAALGSDPNFATTMTNLLAAKAPLASPALTGNPTGPTPAQFDNDASLATTAFVQAALGNKRIATSITAGRAITLADFGGEFVVSAASAVTLTLPNAATVANGASIRLVNLGVGTCTLARTGADTFIGAFNSGGAATSVSLLPNDDVTVTQYGGLWLVIGSGACLTNTSGTSGFRYIGGGLFEQWGEVVGAANPANGRWEFDVVFPTAFPTQCLSVVACAGISTTDLDASDGAGGTYRANKTNWQVGIPLPNKFEATVWYTDVPNNVRHFSWRAIGK